MGQRFHDVEVKLSSIAHLDALRPKFEKNTRRDISKAAEKFYQKVKKNRVQKPSLYDLVFFKISRGKKVSHVGVYAGGDKFIHAPGKGKKIRQDMLSNTYYAARYVGARNYIQ